MFSLCSVCRVNSVCSVNRVCRVNYSLEKQQLFMILMNKEKRILACFRQYKNGKTFL